jgi:hypothetical protein
VDYAGNIYVGEYGNHRVQIFDATGQFVAKWGQIGTEDEELCGPGGWCLLSGGFEPQVVLADYDHDRVARHYAQTGAFLAQVGEPGARPGQFLYPSDVAYDGQFDQIAVCDSGNHRIQFFQLHSYGDLGTTALMSYAGGINDLGLSYPDAVVCASTQTSQIVYIADWGNDRILKVERTRDEPGVSPLHVWQSFKLALEMGLLPEACSFIWEGERASYQADLEDLQNEGVLGEFTVDMDNMVLREVRPGFVRYDMVHEENNVGLLFPVHFGRNPDGTWCIIKF